jgi:cytochrome c2
MILLYSLRALVLLALAGLAACGDNQSETTPLTIADGDPELGHSLIQSYGCGTCHVIEGVRGARGKVGPRLENYAQQHLLAGFMPNVPLNLIAWLMDPVALKPQTGMPSQGVTEAEARHIAAYLYTLGEQDRQVYPPDPSLPLRDQVERPAGRPASVLNQVETAPRTRRIVPGVDVISQ